MISAIDLVREQIRVAAGAPLGYDQSEIHFSGHSIECRINAENPETFVPSPGRVQSYHAPGGLGVRVDSALYDGYRIPPHYDSLIAKLIVHGTSRNECLMRLRRALVEEFVITGVDTSLPLAPPADRRTRLRQWRLSHPLAGGAAGPASEASPPPRASHARAGRRVSSWRSAAAATRSVRRVSRLSRE